MQVTPSVRLVAVPEASPTRPRSTNIFLVGKTEVLSIDSGEAIDKFKWMLRGYLAAIERTEIALAGITHHHFDHSGNLKEFQEALKAEILVPERGVSLLEDRLPTSGVQTLRDGRTIDLDGGVHVQVIETPGHSVDSICYYVEEDGVLFTGDTLLGVGTTTVGDLGPYRRSLQRLVDLPNLTVICPGHGPIVHDARDRLQMYIDHRRMREEQILQTLQAQGPLSSWDIMRTLYTDIDKRLRRSADGNVRAHLTELAQAGRVRVREGTTRKPGLVETVRNRAAARLRRDVIARGKRLEARERERGLAQQENPPLERWAKMPEYELIDPGDAP